MPDHAGHSTNATVALRLAEAFRFGRIHAKSIVLGDR